jgi:hypothetical protein
MKQLTTFSGKTYYLEEDEAKNVKKMWSEDPLAPIELRCGAMLNPKTIESVDEPDPLPIYTEDLYIEASTKKYYSIPKQGLISN